MTLLWTNHTRLLLLLLLSLLCAAGCPGVTDYAGPPGAADGAPGELPCGADCHEHVFDSLKLPTSASQNSAYGLSFKGERYNGLGSMLSLTAAQGGGDLQRAIDDGFYRGNMILLLRLVASSLQQESQAQGQLLVGEPAQCCKSGAGATACEAEARKACFDGEGTFVKSQSSPPSVRFSGSIDQGRLALGPATMTIQIGLSMGSTFSLTLKHGTIEGLISSAGITQGVLAGAIPRSEVNGTLVPELAQLLDELIKRKGTDPQTQKLVRGMFDQNADGSITAAELQGNALLKGLLAGDIDVDGDGEKELSLGLGFSAVPCTITLFKS